ncbi:hypothetical protein LCGC14_2229500, partial [marine sediment metagenome]
MEDERGHAFPAPEVKDGKVESEGVFKGEKPLDTPDSKIEPPLSVYEQIKGEPYTIRYFGLTDWLYFMNNPQFDVSGLKDQVSKVEQFVKNEIERKSLMDSSESYRSIIENIKVKLKIDPLQKSEVTFAKIYKFIK